MKKICQMIECNPTVKLTKNDFYPLIDIDKINIGYKIVSSNEIVEYIGQSCSKFQNGDTLMARITPCLENGKIAQCRIPSLGLGSTEFFVFRAKEGKADKDYVYYLFNTSYMRKLAANSMSGASGRQRADINFIKNRKWNFPSLPIQCKISNLLSQYDALIENNNKRIKLLEQMAENLYKEWFVRFRFPNYRQHEFHDKIPFGWHEGHLSNLCNFSRGKNITSEQMITGEYKVISAGLEPSGYHNEANVKGISITVSASGANAGYVSFHQNDIWAADCSFVTSQNTKNIYYLYGLINCLRPIITNLQIGSAQPHVYPNQLNKIKILVPSEQLMSFANEKLSYFYKQIHTLMNQNQNLIKQRDLLLPRLMSGKLEV